MDTKTRPLYMLYTRDPPQNIQTESKRLEKDISSKWRPKESRGSNTPDKIDFEIKAMKKDKERHYVMIKGSIHKEDVTIQEEDVKIINIFAPNIGAPQYVRQMLTSMKGEINSNTIIVGDFNTPLTPMDRSTKQKINKETQTLNDTMDQLDLTFSQRSLRLSSFPLILFYFLGPY